MAGYIIHYSTTSEVDRQKVASFIMTNYKTYCRLTDVSTWIIGTSDDTENQEIDSSQMYFTKLALLKTGDAVLIK